MINQLYFSTEVSVLAFLEKYDDGVTLRWNMQACVHAAWHSNEREMPRSPMLLRFVANQEIKWKLTGTTPAQCYAHCAGKHIDSWSCRTVLISVLLQARVWAIHERFWWIRAIHPAVFMVIGPFQCCRHAVRLLTLLGHCSVSSSRSISML